MGLERDFEVAEAWGISGSGVNVLFTAMIESLRFRQYGPLYRIPIQSS